MTQRSKFRLQRRGWGGFFADSFFPSFLSFRFFPRSILWPILALSVDEKKGGSQSKLIGIRERRLTWSFPWKKLWRNLVGKSCFERGITGGGEPLLRETDISPRGARNFRLEEKSVSSLAKFSWERYKGGSISEISTIVS